MVRKLPVLAVIAILIGTALLLPAPAPAQQVLKIGYPVWVGYGPLFLADKKGFLKDEGVSVQFINMEDTKTRYVALAAGKIDGLMTTIDTIVLRVRPDFQIAPVRGFGEAKGGGGVVPAKAFKRSRGVKSER